MLYPFTILSEWYASNEPLFNTSKNGEEYCLITVCKNFKSGNTTIHDSLRVQCFGDECTKVKYIMEKNHESIKNIPLDIYADRVPYMSNGELLHSYRATKISVGSSFYYSQSNNKATETEKKETKMPSLIEQLDSNPFR